jgi:hypothetical protein
MPAIDVAAEIRATALTTINAQCLGEDFGFDCRMVINTTQRPMVVLYQLVTSIQSPLLGEPPLNNISQIISPHPDQVAVEQVVTEAMAALRQLRKQLLAKHN